MDEKNLAETVVPSGATPPVSAPMASKKLPFYKHPVPWQLTVGAIGLVVCSVLWIFQGAFLRPQMIIVESEPFPDNSVATTEADMSEWKTYRNEKLGFEFQYPAYFGTLSSVMSDVMTSKGVLLQWSEYNDLQGESENYLVETFTVENWIPNDEELKSLKSGELDQDWKSYSSTNCFYVSSTTPISDRMLPEKSFVCSSSGGEGGTAYSSYMIYPPDKSYGVGISINKENGNPGENPVYSKPISIHDIVITFKFTK